MVTEQEILKTLEQAESEMPDSYVTDVVPIPGTNHCKAINKHGQILAIVPQKMLDEAIKYFIP